MPNIKGPAYKGLANPLLGKHNAQGLQAQHPIGGVGQESPIGSFKIGRKSESKKVKEIFG